MDKNSLMASLMGDELEQDLFGDVPLVGNDGGDGGPPPASAAAAAMPENGDPLASLTTSTENLPTVLFPPSSAPSLLAQSGLLGLAVDHDTDNVNVSDNVNDNIVNGKVDAGGGLFDAVDQEEERKEQQERERQAEAQEQLRQAEVARRQQQQQQQSAGFGLHASQPNVASSYLPPPQTAVMAQSVTFNYNNNTVPPQPVQPAGMPSLLLAQPPNQGFYREHPPLVISTGPPPPANTYGGAPPGSQYYYGTREPQVVPQMMIPAPPHPTILHQQQQQQQQQPNITAGMHNSTYNSYNGGSILQQRPPQPPQVRKITLVPPKEVPPLYTDIIVSEPMLIQQQTFLLSSAPYWSYQISTQLAHHQQQQQQQGTWLVRRRFRHIVALEERLRQTCPGSILPPRPDKHATRVLEEASSHQSAEFALQRARELNQYLNALAKHPVAGQSQVLRLFLGLQDDIGTAWPEVSGNALTQLGAVAASLSLRVAETKLTAATASATNSNAPAHEWEDDAELLVLSGSENLRMAAVSQAVPKLEGTVTVLRELGDAAGAVGMELSKVSKIPASEDLKVCDVLSHGLLRHGRRTKRLALELSAAMDSFLLQYRMVRYEKMALQDRRHAIQKKGTYRRGADQRALYLAQHQQRQQLQSTGQFGQLNHHLEQSAIQTDIMANEFVGEAEEIAARLKSEIHRVAIDRRIQWHASMKTIANAMKEACTERVAIWESTLEALRALPGGMFPVEEPTGRNGVPPGGGTILTPASTSTSSTIQGNSNRMSSLPFDMNHSVTNGPNNNGTTMLDTSTIYA